MDIITRKEARVNGLKQYFTGKRCKHGHLASRWVSTMTCIECSASRVSEWRINNPDHQRIYRNQWRKDNPEKVSAHRKHWENNHARKYYYTKRRENPERYMMYRAKQRAKKMNLPFDIIPADIIIPSHCPVLGMPLEIGSYDGSPSLDRIIPERGYVKDNIVIVSAKANRIKNDASIEEMRRVLEFYEVLLG